MLWFSRSAPRLVGCRVVITGCQSQRTVPVPTFPINYNNNVSRHQKWNHSASSANTSSSTTSSSTKSSWLSRVVAWYDRQLEQRPFLTKGLTGGLVAAHGDLLCQFLMYRHKKSSNGKEQLTGSSPLLFWNVWNMRRTVNFFCLGSMWVAPVLHVWYGFLSRPRAVVAAAAGAPASASKGWLWWWQLGQRVALDQFVFTPVFAPTFLMGLWCLEGTMSWDKIQRQLPAMMPTMLGVNWLLWIPAQAINFSVIPIPYQVLFSNMVSLFWNAILSFLEQQKHSPDEVSTATSALTLPTPTTTLEETNIEMERR